MVMRRRVDRACPVCEKLELFAVEPDGTKVHGYYCKACKSKFHAHTVFGLVHGKYLLVGRLLNPDYWDLDNTNVEEGIIEMAKRDVEGISKYLDDWVIEEAG